MCSDNNKCLGCGGANVLPYLVESAMFICGNFHKNAQLQINGGYYLRLAG